MEKILFAVSVGYRVGSGSKHAYEEVRLQMAEDADQAIAAVKLEGGIEEQDLDDYEFEVEMVDFQMLEKGESQRVFGHYYN